MMAALKGPGWEVIRTLMRTYRVRKPSSRGEPFEVLIQTILSQNTNDLNSGRAFDSLRKAFPITSNSLARAPFPRIAEAIRVGGLHNTKAARIKEISAEILRRHPDGLGFLSGMDDDAVRAALTRFKGVGPKTADIVLDFSLGRDVVPVDTHVNRVSKRIGFASKEDGYENVRASLEAAIPRGRRLEGHIALILHGRRTCKAARPLCHACPVSASCRYYAALPGRRRKERP
jgi:endonuclease-3